MEMVNLLNFQADIAKRIGKARVNFKKSPKDRITKEYIEGRLEVIEQLWFEFLTGHKEIVRNTSPSVLDESSYYKSNVYDETQETYICYKSELKLSLNSLIQDSNEFQKTPSNDGKRCQVKLPKISIPTFSGKYCEWNTFRDLFRSLVHLNQDLDNVQRLQYLKGYITGEAEQLLRHIPVTEINYDRCWKLLEDRYNNKKFISHHILKRLLSQKNIVNESASGLKDLIDTTNDCLSALSNLGINVDSWDIIIIHILTLKLDSESRRQWEFNITSNNSSDELPTYQQFKDFLTNRYRAIEFIDTRPNSASRVQSHHNAPVNKVKSLHVVAELCPFCSEQHKLGFCKKFVNESVETRRDFVQSNNICFACLGLNHSAKACYSNLKCKICKKKHHTILHPRGNNTNNVVPRTADNVQVVKDKREEGTSSSHVANTAASPVVSCFSTRKLYNTVLLATALVKAMSKNKERYTVRALIDQGSQSSFVTESTVQRLGLKKTPVSNQISGIGGEQGFVSKAIVNFEITSRVDPNVVIGVQAYVLKSITSILPSCKIEPVEWSELIDLTLADPDFHTPNHIDLLLGAEIHSQIILDGVKKGPLGTPVAQLTTLGWILSGTISTTRKSLSTINVMHCQVDDNDLLKKFWELEADMEMPKDRMFTAEEARCEEIFYKTTLRDDEGRYIVRLPFKTESPPEVTNSLKIAEKRLISLEHKLKKNEDLKEKYKDVINEYLTLNHMEEIPFDQLLNPHAVYLPHHAVVREKKETSQVRVVYDASCRGANNMSLNDNLLVGPTLQLDLRHVVMKWRSWPICFSADITKMYRQVKVNDKDIDFQRILWRDDSTAEMKHYRLLRVTFGTASAPYLAVKALQQVVVDEGDKYPLAAKRVLTDFYMDDLLTGCETKEEGIKLYKEMNGLLAKGGFEIQKWTTNSNDLIKEMKNEERKGKEEEVIEKIRIKTDEVMKIVGITWNRTNDDFSYSVELPSLEDPVTKRKIIADISRFYDPLGWAGPSIIVSKIIIQQLWLAGLGWDDAVPDHILREWLAHREGLKLLSEVHIPRWIGIRQEGIQVELHGFSDASKVAYAAVVYSRVIDSEGHVQVALLSAKTKVAPVKQISIPKLELCGAVLVTRLLTEIAAVMNVHKTQIHAWTDSTVVLAWINSHPSRWQVFVANRVSEIITKLDSHNWSHVTSKNNPADCASRGMQPDELVGNELWFRGPKFLSEQTVDYKRPKNLTTELEQAKVVSHCSTSERPLWERFGSLSRMVRVIAYCRRFTTKHPNTYLTTKELTGALNVCIRQCQAEHFSTEIDIIKRDGNLPKSSSLRALNPFLDQEQLLRVGGRLDNSNLSDDRKHPIIVPKNSHLTKLIIVDAHHQTLHGGPQVMMAYIQAKYWIIGLKQVVKAYYRKCVICVKNAAKARTPLMGQLPSTRVTPSRPFKNSGVDYAGPIQIRTSKGRGHKSEKGYICLFVCMVTRAVHLEAVTNLTTEGFLQAFKRFVARRGHCSDIWSDNGTNFTGAANELKRLLFIENKSMLQEVAESLATNGCNWHFIPSHSPNFGGLWEAGVKSVKYHLRRVIGQSTLTFEEITTVLAQVEAVLNSRPLSTINCNESDAVTVLTPGHFLVGEPLVLPADCNYETSNVSSLRRWQHTQKMTQDFWRQWSKEYLTKFYHRYRFSADNPQTKVGDIVLVKEDGLPACRWLYGRVIATHPGSDNIVRVVTLKVKNGTLKRPVSKLCLLPVTD